MENPKQLGPKNCKNVESDLIGILPVKYSEQIVCGKEILPIEEIAVKAENQVEVQITHQLSIAGNQLDIENERQKINTEKLSTIGAQNILKKQRLETVCEPTNIVKVDYRLDKKKALGKKLAACEREDYKLIHKSGCIVIELNTAAFEYFRSDLIHYLENSANYNQMGETPVKDQEGNTTTEIVRVVSRADTSANLFTINIHFTTSKVMINGPMYSVFVDNDVPILMRKLNDRRSTINKANGRYKDSIQSAIALQTSNNEPTMQEGVRDPLSSRKSRKRKNLEGLDIDEKTRKSKNLVSGSISMIEIGEGVDDLGKISEKKPKYWEKLGYGPWTKNIAKACNKPRGCLKECGKNNSRGMICCDGCGKRCHTKCLKEIIDKGSDFLCFQCKVRNSKVEGRVKVPCANSLANGRDDVSAPVESEKLSEEAIATMLGTNQIVDLGKKNKVVEENIMELLNDMVSEVENDLNGGRPQTYTTNGKQIILSEHNKTCTRHQSGGLMDEKTENIEEEFLAEMYNTDTCKVNGLATVKYNEEKNEILQRTTISANEANETVTLGMQFQDKKCVLTIKNILKEKSIQEDLLYGMLIKMKEKLYLSKFYQQQGVVKKTEVLKLQEANHRFEENEIKLQEVKQKLKKLTMENKDLKNDRKAINELQNELKNEVKRLKETISLKEKSIIGLHERLELARVNEIRLNAKVELLETMTADVDKEMNIIDSTNIDRSAEKIAKIKEGEELLKIKDECLEESSKKISKLERDLSVAKDAIAEKDAYINDVDIMYADIISKKDTTIKNFTKVTKADDELAKGFKRVLMKTLAEKELVDIKNLYNEIRCQDEQTQVSFHQLELDENTGNAVSPSDTPCEVKTNDTEKRNEVMVTDIVEEEIRSVADNSNIEQQQKVTIRVVNLPLDIETEEVEKLFDIKKSSDGRKTCHVVTGKLRDKMLVKIVVPECKACEILKFDQTVLHKRKIRVFLIEKCRLGGNCTRKVCRFGHPERFEQPFTHSQPTYGSINGEERKCGDSLGMSGRQDITKFGLWKISNFPADTGACDVGRHITSLIGVSESQYQVLSVKNYVSKHEGRKVEAVLSMPEDIGMKLSVFNGKIMEDSRLFVKRTRECRYGVRCFNANNHCPFYHKDMLEQTATNKDKKANNEMQQRKEFSLWKLRNLPEKMGTAGVLRYVRNLNIMGNVSSDHYEVLYVRSYSCNEGIKVEAMISMPEEMGQRLLMHHGTEIENSRLEVSRRIQCKNGMTCPDVDNNCPFYHGVTNHLKRTHSNKNNSVGGETKPICWFQNSCPFPGSCKFAHFENPESREYNQSNSVGSKNC